MQCLPGGGEDFRVCSGRRKGKYGHLMPYFDCNATVPLHPVARAAWLEASDTAGLNPGGPYRAAARVHARLDDARERMAVLLGARPDRVVFTSGATESINTVIAGMVPGSGPDDRVAITATEHPAVRSAAGFFWGERVIELGVDGLGRLDSGELARRLLTDRPRLACIMAANNETGVVTAVEACVEACRAAGVPMLCDATQWVGKLPTSKLEGTDFLVGGAHKFGGPKGIGFLRLPAGGSLPPLIQGGGQEGGHRAGTENVPSILAMVAVLEHIANECLPEISGREVMRAAFEEKLKSGLPGVRIVGEGADRLWNTVSVILPGGDNGWWVQKLDQRGFEVSTGSACASGHDTASHVLTAHGLTAAEARRTLRLSASWGTEAADWEALGDAMVSLAAEQTASPVIRVVDPES